MGKAEDKKEIRKTGRGSHPNSRANLKPAQTGEVRNPNGKAEGTKDRATILKKWLSVELELLNPVTKAKEKGTVEDEVMLALITKARKGDVPAIREVLDSTYGKITEHQDITSKGESVAQPIADALEKVFGSGK